MLNRRAFVQALVGVPIAAVVMPRASVPVVPPVATVTTVSAHHYAARYFSRDATARPGRELTITLKADTSQFSASIDETHRHLNRLLHDRFLNGLKAGGRR